MRRHILFANDLLAAAVSPFFALAIRDGEFLASAKFDSVVMFSAISLFVAIAVFVVADVHRGVGRYMSLPDLGRVAAAASIVVLLSLVVLFALNRLEGIPRSLPLIAWLCLITLVCGARVAARLWREWRLRAAANRPSEAGEYAEPVIVVGLNVLTELYLQAVKDLAPGRLQVVGILARGDGLKGRLVQRHEILGRPEELTRKLAELEVHGVDVRRIVVTEALDRFSEDARAQLFDAERARGLTLDLFTERLGLEAASPAPAALGGDRFPPSGGEPGAGVLSYRRQKRAVDIVGAIVLIAVFSPVFAVVGLAVALDVGLPLIFWQRRAGVDGRPFNLYKFRTMKAAHDASGGRVLDSDRVSGIGRFLRRTRFDELPQLYNVLVGEMSLVGPRPLLPQDLPPDARTRSKVRPGLSGWAQVNGGRDVSIEDKAALDAWYVDHLSPSIDFKVLRRTIRMVIWGERMNWKAIRLAWRHANEAGGQVRNACPREAGEEAAASLETPARPTSRAASLRGWRRQIDALEGETLNGSTRP